MSGGGKCTACFTPTISLSLRRGRATSTRWRCVAAPRQDVAAAKRVVPPSPTFDADGERAYFSGQRTLAEDWNYEITDIEGEIPAGLSGVMYRNGGGNAEIGEDPIRAPSFDGDGLVTAVRFAEDGKVYFRSKYVDTEGRLAEQKAGKMLFRSVVGNKPGGWTANFLDLAVKNTANINCMYFGDRLWALYDGGLPHRLDPHSLETLGIDDLDGFLRRGRAIRTGNTKLDEALGVGDALGAHSKIVGDRLCALWFMNTGSKTEVTLSELDHNLKPLSKQVVDFDGFGLFHDQGVTESYRVLFQSSIRFDALPFLVGTQSLIDSLVFDEKLPSQVHVVPRDGSEPFSIAIPEPGYCFHIAGAYESGDELVLDANMFRGRPSMNFYDGPRDLLNRIRIDLKTKSVVSQTIVAEEFGMDFCCVGTKQLGEPYRYIFSSGSGNANNPNNSYLKVDMDAGYVTDAWFAPKNHFVSEALFVERPGRVEEDDGWLLGMVYDGNSKKSYVTVHDAKNLGQGPVAKLNLRHHVPYNIHGCFVPNM
eukprot:CAMPEP_0198336384 /NCGR_PEP_ID=MMETSP1450-20131203/20966_1 /TAXON_ID=753684 ORGANISM="Madagascaria erythrocladiodes, Strain CCMP3234" /NCGR_SAMPLE_ID=MMETSP1450 /ASSEMBLY_ACC=CAM_ASM_001115 /LENGTH=534 /DNA_ID=CAMNT_0044041123 /DNA_START=56 /DNA_END=1660 /DNA_ORIENTATION=+